MKTRCFRLVICIAAFVALTGCAFSQVVKVTPDFELGAISQGTPVVITVRFFADTTVRVDLGENRTQAIEFEVVNPSAEHRLIVLPLPQGLTRLGEFELNPRVPYEQMMILAASYFQQPGTYQVFVHIKNNEKLQFHFEQGNPLTLLVSSRDETLLRESCSILASKMRETSMAGRRMVLADALANVADPVALPYLVDSLDHGWGVDFQLIRGIEKIGTSDAVTALAKASHSDTEEIAASARSALMRLSHNSTEITIRNQAESFVVRQAPK